jgi:predicted signal transduction protein with EAL and GGDEF domain
MPGQLAVRLPWLGQVDEDDAIVGAVITPGRGLGLQICAEGVETAAQATRLRRLGRDQARGYFFARPLAPEAFAELLADTAPVILGESVRLSLLPMPARPRRVAAPD